MIPGPLPDDGGQFAPLLLPEVADGLEDRRARLRQVQRGGGPPAFDVGAKVGDLVGGQRAELGESGRIGVYLSSQLLELQVYGALIPLVGGQILCPATRSISLLRGLEVRQAQLQHVGGVERQEGLAKGSRRRAAAVSHGAREPDRTPNE